MTTSGNPGARPTLRFVFSHPAHFIAFGFGAGLSPVAPGTFGTLLAFPIYIGLSRVLSDPVFIFVLLALFVLGVWACEITGRNLGVHDHGGMVWDETVAFLLVLFLIPQHQLTWAAFAFLLFRLFDILKPPPIGKVDMTVRNGIGVMLDDIIAAFYALLCLAGWKLVFG
ncbi:MAG TPA: phosphatidylglycerophosphatase A [Burkholderiales bacterium]|nr:phosphatidylglycerophosphatase A [Burkholderiales bacterium]